MIYATTAAQENRREGIFYMLYTLERRKRKDKWAGSMSLN